MFDQSNKTDLRIVLIQVPTDTHFALFLCVNKLEYLALLIHS